MLWSIDRIDYVDDVNRGRQGGDNRWQLCVPFLVFDDDTIAQLTGTGQSGVVRKVPLEKESCNESIAKDLMEDLRHLGLLLQGAMVLHREDDRVRRRDESTALNGLDDGTERNFGGECVAVVDHGLAVVTVPTVELHASATR